MDSSQKNPVSKSEADEPDLLSQKHTPLERVKLLLDSGLDVKFLVGYHDRLVFKAHKNVFAVISPVFESMFFGSVPQPQPVVIPDIEPAIFRELIRYIYTNTVNFEAVKDAFSIYYAADKYMLPDLSDRCIQYLKDWISPKYVFRALEQALQDIKRDNPPLLNVETIKKFLHLLLLATETGLNLQKTWPFKEIDYMEHVLSLVEFLLDLLPMSLTDDDVFECLSKLLRSCETSVRLGFQLEMACRQLDVPDLSDNSFAAARLLLQAGADPNSSDYNGDGPLHFVANLDLEKSEAIGCLLLRYGAQLHRPNMAGKTALDVWIDRNEGVRADWCRTVPKLSCLSARCIRVHKVPYSKLPTVFHPFIEKH